jgi:hypothetical protein
VADALQTVFTTFAEAAARDTGLIKRRRLLTGPAFAQGLVFTWMDNADATYEELAAGARAAGADLSVSALEERFTGRAADFFRSLLEAAVGQMLAADPVAVTALDCFTDVTIDDASTIALPAALAELWPGCGGSTLDSCPAALKVYPRLSLRSGALTRLELTSGRSCDQTCPAQSEHPQRGSLHLADLGFFSLDTLRARAERGVYFLGKVQTGTLLADPEGDFKGLLAHLGGCRARKVDKEVRLGKRHQIKARLLAIRLPKAAVRRRRKRVWEEARRKSRRPSAESLALCRWLVLVTNAPAHLLGLLEALALYRARWQVALFFKGCKSVLGLDRYRLGDFDCVEGWVKSCLLAFVYLEWYRLRMLGQSRGNPAEQRRWRWQRSYGLARAVGQDVQEQDLHTLAELLQSPEGVEQLKQRLRRAVQKEYRKAG